MKIDNSKMLKFLSLIRVMLFAGEASGHNISQLGVLDALRIHVQRTSNSWVILNEVSMAETVALNKTICDVNIS